MTIDTSRIPPDIDTYMDRALQLARLALGRTDPNPMVGAVVVKHGRIVGEGYHRAAGRPHAEIEALNEAGDEARGSDLYVTLEPCNHYGRTPPCTQAILKAGVKRVIFGMSDPNPQASGGIAVLNDAGVETVGPIRQDECARLNEVYVTNITLHRPFVFLKLAMSLDGRIATRTGNTRWITSPESRRKAHELRDRVSAILVGIGTVIADDPSLTTRLEHRSGKDPVRVVADSGLRTPPTAKIFNPRSDSGVIIACRQSPPEDRVGPLERVGARILRTTGDDRVDFASLMDELFGWGITSVMVEGGASVAWAVLEAGLVDRCMFFYAPIIIGGRGAPSGIEGLGVDTLAEAPRLTDITHESIGPDLLVQGLVERTERSG